LPPPPHSGFGVVADIIKFTPTYAGSINNIENNKFPNLFMLLLYTIFVKTPNDFMCFCVSQYKKTASAVFFT